VGCVIGWLVAGGGCGLSIFCCEAMIFFGNDIFGNQTVPWWVVYLCATVDLIPNHLAGKFRFHFLAVQTQMPPHHLDPTGVLRRLAITSNTHLILSTNLHETIMWPLGKNCLGCNDISITPTIVGSK
jgi:hypothetical protein